MSSIGEKIKDALTGHSHKDSTDANTSDVNELRSHTSDEKKVAEGQSNLAKVGHQHRDNEIGAGHTQGRHDPEVDAKEATSEAGNYPYWGDLPRDGEQGHTHQPGSTFVGGSHGRDSHNSQKESGLAAGGLASGAGVAGAGLAGTGSRTSEYEQGPLANRTRDTGLPSSSTQDSAATTRTARDGHKGEIAAATGAGAAGVAGATYLGNRHKDEDTTKSTTSGMASGPTQAGPGNLDAGYASQVNSSNEYGSQQRGFGQGSSADDSPYATTRGDSSHHKGEAALAAGAGAAGLGGAGYLAHKRGEDQSRADEKSSGVYGSQQRDTTSSYPSSQSQSTTGGGIHNTVVGAGSTEDNRPRSHKTAFDSSLLSSSGATTVGPQYGTDYPREQTTTTSSGLGAPNSRNDREKQGLAAAAGVGAGAGVVAAEEKHRHHEHHHHDHKSKDQGHTLFGSSQNHDQSAHSNTASQPSAQLAAQEAWGSNQTQNAGRGAGTRHDPESEARQATSGAGNYPYQGDDRSSTANTGHQHHTAALGAAAGVGLAGAGATAAYYGQGKEHDQNPRSDMSQKVADRALGSDGVAHAPSTIQGQTTGTTGGSTNSGSGLSSTGLGAAGLSGGSGFGSSKVVHKCHQCGADNDISDYFKKDATFRSGS